MSLTPDDVKRIARLARIETSDAEAQATQAQLNTIFDLIATMQAVAELGVKANVVGLVASSENLPSGRALKPGDVVMLENTRFHPSEEKNDLELAKQMAALAAVYVNDAFGSAHRAH